VKDLRVSRARMLMVEAGMLKVGEPVRNAGSKRARPLGDAGVR
jgi:hypothetical protein